VSTRTHVVGSTARGAALALGAALLAVLLALLLPATSWGQDLQTELTEAQQEEAAAISAIGESEAEVARAEEELAPVAERAADASREAEAALTRLDRLEEQMTDRRVEAAEEVAALQGEHEDELAAHDESRDGLIGLAIGTLLLALVVLMWETFRDLPVVSRFAGQRLNGTIAILGVLLLLTLLVGGVMLAADGLVRTAGAAILVLGIGMVVALWVARHSILRERGEAQAILSRDRLPRKVTLALAALLALLFAGVLGGAVTNAAPDPPSIPDKMEELAAIAKEDPASKPTDAVEKAESVATPKVTQARKLERLREEGEERVREARTGLLSAKRRLTQAREKAARYSRLIAEQQAAAKRAAAREAARAARLAQQPDPAPAAPSPSAGYENCDEAPDNIPVGPGSSLDADGDGIGCET
jgi:hypothetical protein